MSEIDTNFLRDAFGRYLARFDTDALEPTDNYLPYDFESEVAQYKWDPIREQLVADELRDLTNILNNWHGMLRSWHAWNQVLASYGEEESRGLQFELLEIEALVHCCLLKPSDVRDTFTFIVTNAMHQVRLALDTKYKDQLEGDPASQNGKPKSLARGQKEDRLEKLIDQWHEGKDFIAAHRKIDDSEYRNGTRDYRNRWSHAIGPRLGIGHTQFVTREVIQATEMEHQDDGTYAERQIPGKMAVSYAFGGIPPLDMEQARTANLDQYFRARATYDRYRILLAAGMSALPKKV